MVRTWACGSGFANMFRSVSMVCAVAARWRRVPGELDDAARVFCSGVVVVVSPVVQSG